MKTIIQRKLPLDTTYILVDKKYISLVDGCGCTCDNCGKLIANIATIKSVSEIGKTFNIGFDCLDTILENNAILSNFDLQDYQQYKKAISKVMKFIKKINIVLLENKSVTGLLFEKHSYISEYYTYHYLHNNAENSRDNDYVKIKDLETSGGFEILIKIMNDYFVNSNKIKILVK